MPDESSGIKPSYSILEDVFYVTILNMKPRRPTISTVYKVRIQFCSKKFYPSYKTTIDTRKMQQLIQLLYIWKTCIARVREEEETDGRIMQESSKKSGRKECGYEEEKSQTRPK